jgi:hypothetical protein
VVTGALFTKMAGKGVGAMIGLVAGLVALVGVLFKTFGVIVHQDQYAAHVFFGRPAKRGMVMYPLRNAVRKVLVMSPMHTPNMDEVPEKTSGPGLRPQFPVIGRKVIIDTQDREGEDRTVGFYILVKDEHNHVFRLNFEAVVSLGWGVPADRRVYPKTAVLNPNNFEKLCEDLMADAVRAAFSQGYRDGALTEEDFQNAAKVFAIAERICAEELLQKHAAEFRFLRIFGVTTVPMQSGELAAAIRSTAARPHVNGISPNGSAAVGALAAVLHNQPQQ